tara:strand:+ start:2016 stop:3536 length:1521 start_codon:yes stop_codon:yes gene_type:complete
MSDIVPPEVKETRTKGLRGNKQTPSLRAMKDLLFREGKKSGKGSTGIQKDARRIFNTVFKQEELVKSLENEEYTELIEILDEYKKFFDVRPETGTYKDLSNLLNYEKGVNTQKKRRVIDLLDKIVEQPNDKEAISSYLVEFAKQIKNRTLENKFLQTEGNEELDKLTTALTKSINKETMEVLGAEENIEQEETKEPKLKGIVERVMEAEKEEEEKEAKMDIRDFMPEETDLEKDIREDKEEGETLDELLEDEEQPETDQTTPDTTASASTSQEPTGETIEEPTNEIEMEVKKPQRRTETISNPVGQNLIEQIPKEMISTQFKNIEELEEEIQFLLDKFPRLLLREREIYQNVDLEDIDQLRRLHKTIIGKLGADKPREQIAVVIPAEDYIKAEVNKILLQTALKNMRAEDIIQTINMPNRQGETDGLTVGDFVVREGNTSGLQNQGQPIYRYIPTTNQEVEEQQSRSGKIRLNTTKRTRLNVAKREFRNDPFIFRRPQPIRLKYLG